MKLFFSIVVLLLSLASQQQEDERITFIRGVVIQVYSKASSDPQADNDELYKTYQDRIVPRASANDPAFTEREAKFKDLIARLAGFTRAGLRFDELGTNYKLQDQGPDVATVIWRFTLPSRIVPTDNPTAKGVEWTFMLTKQPEAKPSTASWKIYDIAKHIF